MPISLLATEILFNLKTIWKYGATFEQITALVRHATSQKTLDREVKSALRDLSRLKFIMKKKNGLYFSK